MNNIKILGFSDPVSSWSHLLTAILAIIATKFLIKQGRGNAWRIFSLAVYSFTVIYLFSMSGIFHWLDRSSPASGVFQRMDHAGIWTLIAGTFTPVHTILFRGPVRWAVLLFVWTTCITGLVLEVVFFTTFPEWLALTFFLGMGWIGVLSDYKFRRMYPNHSPKLIMFGGLSYSIGAVIDFVRWPVFWPYVIGPHEIFHFFVMAGAFCHWLFINRWANHPISDTFICNVKSYSDSSYSIEAVNDKLDLVSDSLSKIKEQALEMIKKRYHQKPKYKVIFRYFEEEKIIPEE